MGTHMWAFDYTCFSVHGSSFYVYNNGRREMESIIPGDPLFCIIKKIMIDEAGISNTAIFTLM